MKTKYQIWIWAILAFLLGIVVCHLFYYRHSYLKDDHIGRELDKLRKENLQTQKELDKVDSLLNLFPYPSK